MVQSNKKFKKGFTMVELMVVLAITAILAALVGGGLIGYIRLARFEKNEANARTLFQAAQIALTHMDTAGELDDFRAQVRDVGDVGTHFTDTTNHTQAELDELNSNIYALYYDKTADDTSNNQLVHNLLDEYIYDESLLDASVCIEIDAASGQVYSVFYDTNSDKLRFTDSTGQTNIIDRSYSHRRNDSLVGYYSAEDRVNVVELQQTRLKVKNPRLSNTETLTLSWDGDENRDTQVQYIAKAYSAVGNKLLFEIEIKLPGNKTEQITELHTKIYGENETITKETDLSYPLSYNKGSFVLTLDAMASADLLRACENDKDTADTSLFSIIRLLPGNTEPQDFYITMQAQPREGYNDNYTASTEVKTNTENTLFAEKSTAQKAELKYYRHLYNTRWVDENSWKVTGGATYTMTPQGFGVSVLNWTAGSVTVYCPNDEPNGKPAAKVPSTENPVAWPTIPKLSDRITLNGSNLTLANLQLRGTSVSATGKQKDDNLLDCYIGLVGENNGTLKNITLRDVDLQVNAEVIPVEQAAAAGTTLKLTDTTVLRALDDQNTEYRGGVRAVGALCGVNTGTLENCSLTHGLNNALKSQVLAMLPFDETATVTAREEEKKQVNNKEYTYYTNEPRGIGGLVGVAIPKDETSTGVTAANLEVASNVTVAGLLQDKATTTANNTTVNDKARYTAAAAEPGTTTETVWRSVGVGGVFGTLDAAGLKTADQTNADAAIKNAAAVTGNGFVGGIAGNIYNSAAKPATVTGLANTGTVSAGATYQGSTEGGSRVLGQFFGGLAGYTQNVKLTGCTSSTRSNLTGTSLTSQIQKGYDANGIIQESSPLKGDFVGGLIGFGKNITLTNCSVQKGYVLGRTFVGGIAGGFTGSSLEVTGGTNASYVFGNRYVGGIVSVNGAGSTISSMENTGLVAGLGQNAAYVGGIAGLNDATWGATGTATTTTAAIKNCTNSMASDNATNSSRITLLKNLSTYMVSGKEETIYADFVGGLVGSNGTNAVLTWDGTATTVSMGAVLYGKNYVGGVAGYNDATAQITNTKGDELTVTGQVIGEAVAQTGTDGTTVYVGGKAVGGMVGLNMAPNLPMVNVKTSLVHGELCVGGVIGANMPVAPDTNTFTVTSSKGTGTGNFATQTANGRVEAEGLAGGIIGYNCLLSAAPEQITERILPSVDNNGGKLQIAAGSGLTYNTQGTVKFTGFANQLNISANAYVGGIVGYNYGETKLIITNATNGTQSNAASTGRVSKYNNNGTLGGGVSLSAFEISGITLTQPNPSDSRTLADRAYFAGGIIGYAAQNTTLQNCTNYGGVTHESVAGGITGWNDGTITNSQTYSALGSQQSGYQYLGGIAGVNNGSIENSAMQTNATVRGNSLIGGVAGVNLPGATITYNNTNSLNYSVQADYCAGGIAGMNSGTVTLGNDTQLNVNVTAGSYAGGIAGSNNTRGTNPATIMGGKVGGAILATGNYAGGAAGANYAKISNVQLVNGGYVRVNGQYAGGIAGNNEGSGMIENCRNTAAAAANRDTVYATNGYAGGISGTNTAQASITRAQVSGNVKVGVALGDASGVTPINNGTISGGSIAECEINATGESIGAVAAINNSGATIKDVTLTGKVKFNSKATNVGGITGNNSGNVQNVTVGNGSLNLNGLTANADIVNLGGAVGTNSGEVNTANVTLDVTDNLVKYVNLGGVVGSNSGTLNQCTYQGVLGTADTNNAGNIINGATNTGDTVGGIVGLNGGKVTGCTVASITLQVQGASALSDSQTTEQKLSSASHVGGIAGQNKGTVESSYVAATANGGSIITARFGFVGGIAGSNSGSITNSGAQGAFTANRGTALVNQVNDWLDETNGDINAMVADMKNDGTGTYSALKGVDTVSESGYGYTKVYTDGLAKNDLLVGLRGRTSANDKAGGYLGGIAGFNSVSGTMTNDATGKWFVYADNTTDDSKVGGMIGMNEATGDLNTLVNCAAVRRFTRKNATNDDNTTNTKNKNIAYVGGIIGVHQNTNDDKWVIRRCVNYGTVFDSGSNFIGGIIASWLKNGGTIERSFNFGNLCTNTNSGDESGTIGGIVGYFDKPTPGGTASILSCQNHGDIKSYGIWEGTKKYGANDIAGILGKVLMADGENDYLRINIVDCVNGDVTMECESLAAGIMGWLGPWGSGSVSNPDKVEVYIDRCRNYATKIDISPKYGQSIIAGICGNRGSGSATTASTTVTNCFALYDQNGTTEYSNGHSAYLAPIATNRGSENIVAYGNYFMDAAFSFNNDYNKAMKTMYEEVQKRGAQGIWGNTNNTQNYYYGTRLFAGVNNSMADGTARFFAAGMMNNRKVDDVDTQYCFINTPTDGSLREIRRYLNKTTSDTRECAKILLWYKGQDGDTTPSMADITDELIQNYYSTMLDVGTPDKVTNLNVTHDNTGTTVYGRYEVTWTAPTNDAVITGNTMQKVSHYLVTLYKLDENGNFVPLGENYTNIVVYGTRYLFDADDDMATALGDSTNFYIGVKAVNGAVNAGEEETTGEVTFLRPLPTPELEVRLIKKNTNGQAYGQYLVLKNASAYQGVSCEIKAYLLNRSTIEITVTPENPEVPITQGLGEATRLRAKATPIAASTDKWMDSQTYDEAVGIPKTYFDGTKVDQQAGNPGLVHGKAFDVTRSTTTYEKKGEPIISGTNTDDLKITVKLSFTPNTILNIVPRYRVMLLGKYAGEQNGGEDKTINGQSLKGQYVTLAAVTKPVYSTESEFVLDNLPDEALDGTYTDLQVISVPVDAGYSQVVTRWGETDSPDEAAAAIENGKSRPISWYNGIEIIRNDDGTFSYAHLTPLQFFAPDDPWGLGNTRKKDFIMYQVRRDELRLNILPAPMVSEEATGTILNPDAENKLNYTFTWTQYQNDGRTPDKKQHTYAVTLYGYSTQTVRDENGQTKTVTIKEKLEPKNEKNNSLASHVKFDGNGKYTLNFCVEDVLATSWQYDKVQIHVTRVPNTNDNSEKNAIGAAGTADCAVMQRLAAVSIVDGISQEEDNNADALHYTVSWSAGTGNVASYTLYAEQENGDAWTYLCKWEGITETGYTVDLEQYQGETLRFYVVAEGKEGDSFRSANGVSADAVIANRTAAPTVSSASLSHGTPSQEDFLNSETLTLKVSENGAASYYYTGYLFKDVDDYKRIAVLAAAYQDSSSKTPAEKAAALTALQTALDEMLTDANDTDRVLRIIADDNKDGGEPTATSTTDSASISISSSFTMKPEYARRWLLPALRSMTPAGSSDAASNWYYYTADASTDAQNMQLPAIKLDAPKADNSRAEYTQEVKLYQNAPVDGAMPSGKETLTLTRRTVEWPIGNLYTSDNGETRSLTNHYQFTVKPYNEDDVPYTVTVTVNDQAYTDADGKEHPIGEIQKVEKTVGLALTGEEAKPLTYEIPKTEADGRVWYDLSLLPTEVTATNENGTVIGNSWSKEWTSRATRLTGKLVSSDTTSYYAVDVVPMLEFVQGTDSNVLRLTLPELLNQPEGGSGELAKNTQTVTVKALPYKADNGEDDKTVESAETLVTVNAPQPNTQEATEPRRVVAVNDITDEQTEPEIAVQAAPQPTVLMETAPVQMKTPETAAPAEPEQTVQPSAEQPAA